MPQQLVIGLVSGTSWESSVAYCRIINQSVWNRLGGVRSARCLAWSFGFGGIEARQHAGRWKDMAALLADAARRLERGSADFFLTCTSTMHRMAGQVQAAVRIPLLRRARHRSGDPGLHRDHAADRARRQPGAGLRHDPHPCGNRGRARAG